MNAHVDLELTAKAAIENRTTLRAAVVAAERAPFLKAEGEGREFVHLQNSLKTLCMAWDERTDGSHRDCVVAAISAVLSAMALWPKRVSTKAEPQRRAACAREIPTPYYVSKDL